ncbi:hypothetical protein L1987_55249 [Smallanthus sonchifolius]|uniref:Uncharacterized protein n=1 Tax=Smallanthus sonchifolius TaxID=185202 RepID=A0ACB9EA18_9ASTR|nr:hypothetical protein L1987_55249 [Smallanthus sonchifolius]
MVIFGSTASEMDGNLSYNRIAILMDHGERIDKHMRISHHQYSFDIWVIEDEETWIPKCLFDNTTGSKTEVSVSCGTSLEIGRRRSSEGNSGGGNLADEEVVLGTHQPQNEPGRDKAINDLSHGGGSSKNTTV